MRCKVKISHHGRVLYEGEYSIEVEGDTERSVTDAIAQARKVRPGPLWDVSIDVSEADVPPIT